MIGGKEYCASIELEDTGGFKLICSASVRHETS